MSFHGELPTHESTIRRLLEDGWTYEQISDHLISLTGEARGLSSRSLRRFCFDCGIRSRTGEEELEKAVLEAITTVGHSYGRRTMQGLLTAQGLNACQSRISVAMERLAPSQFESRRYDTQRMLNPVPYQASYFGEKLHLDQNEKCVMFGVTHVLAIDGYSRKIVGFITIPKKNPIVIYDVLFKPLLQTEGIWDQIRVDHGTEFALLISAQLHLAGRRHATYHQPVLQSMSRQNHRAERIWPEINQRINYPIKRVLLEMENNEEINMGDCVTQFCVSSVAIRVMDGAVKNFILSWNHHRIPGPNGGIPSILATEHNQITRISPNIVPSTDDMITIHERTGSPLQRDSSFGSDPLYGQHHLQELRERDFVRLFPRFDIVFQNIIHGDSGLFKSCVLQFISLTRSFSSLLE